jgi:hypothetical protein
VKKYSRARQTTYDNRGGKKNPQFACQVTKARKQAHTHNIEYLLFFYGNKGYTNMPQCYVYASHLVFNISGYSWAQTQDPFAYLATPCSLLDSIVDISLIL